MSLTREDVEKVSLLARLKLTDEELDALYVQFGIRPPAVLESLPAELDQTED